MPAFDFGGIDNAIEVPEELKTEVDASVRRFEERLGGIMVLAKASGWLSDYRSEITAMVMKGYAAGQKKT